MRHIYVIEHNVFIRMHIVAGPRPVLPRGLAQGSEGDKWGQHSINSNSNIIMIVIMRMIVIVIIVIVIVIYEDRKGTNVVNTDGATAILMFLFGQGPFGNSR